MTAKEMAERWDVTVRQVQFWCKAEMIDGVKQFGKSWTIPESALKPIRTVTLKPEPKPKKVAEIQFGSRDCRIEQN